MYDPQVGDPGADEPRTDDPQPDRPARRPLHLFLALTLSALSCLGWIACDRKTSPPEGRNDDRAEQTEPAAAVFVERAPAYVLATPPPPPKMAKPRAKKVPIPDPTPDKLPTPPRDELALLDAPDLDALDLEASMIDDRASFPRAFESLTFSTRDASKKRVNADALDLREPELPAFDDMSFPIPAPPPIPAGSSISHSQIDGALEGQDIVREEPSTSKTTRPKESQAQKAHSLSVAREWLTARSQIEGLTFQDARGYWANTYLPGDPGLRFLQARLSTQTAADPTLDSPNADLPHALSQRPQPPFDPPSHAALGLHLHADQSALAGRSRLLLQVGLQATERFGGRRTAMNLAVVLHLPSLETEMEGQVQAGAASLGAEDLETLRQLLFALAEQRDFEDRFSLWIAGRSGGLVLSPKNFRHGPMAVLCEQLVRGEQLPGPALKPDDALRLALEDLAATDDPSAPLGSSGLVWIETAAQASTPTIEAQIHSAAVAGLPTTTFGVGAKVLSDTLERWALIGQGRHYRSDRSDRAELQVQQELEAAARTVARAVRLNIRLAPGVELVDVLGSHPLNQLDTGRVKAVEQSVDLRLARRLGITADRGDDDDGIQIVVPSFYAGDYHTILLDVVAEPGPIAEVTAKFKDLVHLDNGVARAHLHLERGESRVGAYERAVLLDRLAHALQTSLRSAGDAWNRGQPSEARQTLITARDLIAGLALERPELVGHPTLIEDSKMIERFIAWIPRSPHWLDESLRYAGWLKAQPAPDFPES